MTLNELLKEISKFKAIASQDPEVGPVETSAARMGRYRNAVEQVEMLTKEYTRELLRKACFILVTGSEKEEFANLASEKFECLTSEADALYVELVSKIDQTLFSGKQNVSELLEVTSRVLEDKATEIGISVYPMLQFKQQYEKQINTREDFLSVLKTAINEQVGGEIVGIDAASRLTETAIARNFLAPVAPIVLTTNDLDLFIKLSSDLERLTPRVFNVVAGKAPKLAKEVFGVLVTKDASEENVQKTLKTIQSNLKK